MLVDVSWRTLGWEDRMYFFFAVVVAFLYVSTASPGSLSTADFGMIVAVAVFSFLGLVDNIQRRR